MILSRIMICIIVIFMTLSILVVNASSTLAQSENFDNYPYCYDYANSTTSSSLLGPFADVDQIKVLWPSTKSKSLTISEGLISVSKSLSPFNTTNSLKQVTSTKRGFLNGFSPSTMSVTLDKITPSNQCVLMQANFLFSEKKFDKTLFMATNTSSTTGQVAQPFKINFEKDGSINVYSDSTTIVASSTWEINTWYHVALLADMVNSTISVYINDTILVENSPFVPQILEENRIIGRIIISKICGNINATDSDKSTVFIDDLKIISGDNISYDISKAGANILSALFYTVDNTNKIIKKVPIATTVSNFKAKIKLAPYVNINLYDTNGVILSDNSKITENTKVVITAADGVTKKMYGLEVIPNTEFSIDGQIIENINLAYGTHLHASLHISEQENTCFGILTLTDNYGKMIKSCLTRRIQDVSGVVRLVADINVPKPVVGINYRVKFLVFNSLSSICPLREVSIL